MGLHDTPLDAGKEELLQLPASLTVLADSDQIEILRTAKGGPWLADAKLVPLDNDEEITEAHLIGTGILVVQIDPQVPKSMRRISRIRSLRPDLPQIVAIEKADIRLVRTLVREGVADVVSLPLDREELFQAAATVAEIQAGERAARSALAPLVAVTRALGGSGATTLATHLAAELARRPASVCIFDLDIQFGRVAEVLGLSPRRNLTDLLDAGVRADSAFLHSVAAEHATGFSVIAAPSEILPVEAVDAEQLRRVIELARHEFDYVLLDIPSNLTNWSLSVLAEADSIILLVEQNLASLRQARRRLDLFGSVGIDSKNVSVVVNRIEKRLFGTIGMSDVERALNHEVLCGLYADRQNIGLAQDQGVLVSELRQKSQFAKDVKSLAEQLAARLAGGDRP